MSLIDKRYRIVLCVLSLVLSVKSESFGSVLPVSYQYELSAAVYRRIRENFELYLHWLSSNGFAPIDDCRNRLFSFSNLYIPRIRVEYDRLHILVKRVQMWISFLPVRGTHEFVKQLFSGETFVLGDRRSRVELEVEDIVECPAPEFGEEAEYLALSPIVFMVARPNRSMEYVGPDYPGYADCFYRSVLGKYEKIFGRPFDGDTGFSWSLLSEPKRKGIFMMRFTPEESKVIGYMYKFKLSMSPILHQIMYETGIGEKVNLGFGCVEILRQDTTPNDQNFLSDEKDDTSVKII